MKPRNGMKMPRWSAEEDRVLQTMINTGASFADVALRLGRSLNVVYQHFYQNAGKWKLKSPRARKSKVQ